MSLYTENLEARLRSTRTAFHLMWAKYYKMKKLLEKERSRSISYKQLYEEVRQCLNEKED